MSVEMKEYLLRVDNGPDLRFVGHEVAAVEDSGDPKAGERYSGYPKQWVEMALFRTKGGMFICHRIDRTDIYRRVDRFRGMVCETHEEVISFFGHRRLAKELYALANISDARVIE